MGRASSLRYLPGTDEVSVRQPTDKSQEEEDLIVKSLRENPNIKRLAPFKEEQMKMLARVAWKEVVEAGRALMCEGELSNATFYIVASGTFEIVSSERFEVVTHAGMSYLSRPEEFASSPSASGTKRTTRRVGRNGSFGDSSMLYGTPRWATISAVDRCELWVICQSSFKIAQSQVSQALPIEKTPADEKLLADTLSANFNLQRLTPLRKEHINDLIKIAWREELAPKQVLMNEGDLNADAFYIVREGQLELVGSEPFEVVTKGSVSYLSRAAHSGETLETPQSGAGRTVRTGGRGLCFGEISMLYCAPRFATIRATAAVSLWAIDRSNFQLIQMKAAEDEVRDRVRYLNSLEVMQSFSDEDREKMAAVMETLRLTKGELLMTEGESSHGLYILYEGAVETLVGGSRKALFEADREARTVHCFGAEALTRPEPAEEGVRVTSAVATALVLEGEEFTKVWDRLLEAAPSPAFERYATSVSKVHQTVALSLDALPKLGLLGAGALGPVELCRRGDTRDLYAVKTMSKGLLVQKGFRSSVIRERTLLTEVISPFIVRCIAALRTEQTLCFVLEAVLGGELSAAYAAHGLHGKVEHARYYVAGAVLALEHLHKRKIVFRNVKPQNILISQTGQPKLTDMSLAKRVVGHTFTTCGTPSYMAPEIVAGTGHARAVDWWSVGVLTFWCMSGLLPFESEHPMEVYAKVMRGIARVSMPAELLKPGPGAAAGELVAALLRPVAIERLAMRQGGISNVMSHHWFSDFNWAAMRTQSMEPPYVPAWKVSPRTWKDLPELSSDVCLEHFSPSADRLPTPVEYQEDGSMWDTDFPTQ